MNPTADAADDKSRLLFAVLSQVRSADELHRLLEDLLTPREYDELALRLTIAQRLHRGETYEAIQQATGASSTTVSRVRRCLLGAAGGYRLVLDRLAAANRS